MLKYFENKDGKELNLKNDRKLYIFSKKKLPEDAEILGAVQFGNLRKENALSEEDVQKLYEKDEDRVQILEYYEKKYELSEKGKGFTKGYIPVTTEDSETQYIKLKSRCIIPLWFIMTTAGRIAAGLTLASMVALSVLAYNLATTPNVSNNGGNVKIADTVPYNDEPVDITPKDVDEYGQEGSIDMNLYSYHVVAQGETLSLTNLSTNDVYLDYIITDGSGENVIYESGKIKPGSADAWVPSKYLSAGENKVQFRIVPYTLEDDKECIGYTSDVIIVIK